MPEDQATHVLPATPDQAAVSEPTAGAPPVEPTAGAPPVEPSPVRDLPAGIDPNELAVAPAASAGRGKLRRRLRYLRRVRELLLRDLGGFIFEIHRSAGAAAREEHQRLVESKASRIAAIDAEVRALEGRLAEPHEPTLLREPGIGGLCPECGELHASDAHYCSRCGEPLDAKARARRDAAAQVTTGSHSAAEPAAASVLWAAGPRPRGHAEPPAEDKEKTGVSAVTSQWLALPQKSGDDDDAAGPADEAARDEEATTGGAAPAGGETAAARPDTAPTGETAAATPDTAPTGETAAATPDTAPDGDDTTPPASDEPTTREAATHDPGPMDDEPPPASRGEDHGAAKPKRSRAGRPDKPVAKDFDPAPNGKRDEALHPPDPLASRPEQRS